ncbi:MAG: YggS family pyridoxal phosphate-dependent enzyme [Oscillospiraceae bacterium]|jgi:pyridoxal phosphate enzyme (YggS family)|nr:YggS family pyridoxal phosphate-dependent enzyme [Oscillospiraceae bacterium]
MQENPALRRDGEQITARADALRRALAEASAQWGVPPLLLAVTKEQPPDRINLLRAAGFADIAESRVQDWQKKANFVHPFFQLHWIGRLQTNKVKYIIESVCLIHSLDRPALADEIGRVAVTKGLRAPALVQINVAGEAQKAGLAPGDLSDFLAEYGPHPGLSIQGLMAVMPQAKDPQTLRPLFRRMRTLFDDTQKRRYPGVTMRHLSMGMSGDCIVAAQEGATIVRVGTALFGPRPARV